MTTAAIADNAGRDVLAEFRRTLRIFISSPGGLGPERQRAREVVAAIAADYAKIIRLEVLLWEDSAYRADRSFVEQIPEARDFDAVVCIIWDTIGGSPIPREVRSRQCSDEPYESGTVYEFETARQEAIRSHGRPALFLFHKTADRIVPVDPARSEERQRAFEAFKKFHDRWIRGPDHSFRSGVETFVSLDEFAAKLRMALAENWLAERLGIGPEMARWDIVRDGSPFVGLASFNATHQRVFRGRDSAIARIIKWLREASARGAPTYFLVRGASGSGKSSLVRAGIAPLVATNTASESWRSSEIHPGDAPLRHLAEAICDALGPVFPGGASALETILRESAGGAVAQITDILERQAEQRRAAEQRDGPIRGRIFLLIDQLEEAAWDDPLLAEQQAAFARAVQALCKNGAVWIVATLRSDLEPVLLQTPLHPLVDPGAWGGGAMPLAPPDAIAEIIEGPANIAGLIFERRGDHDLADEIRADLAGQTDALPLLQMTLKGLFEHDIVGSARTLTFASYEAIGRLPGAIARKADDVVDSLDPGIQAELDAMLRALVRGRAQSGQVVSRPMPLPDAKLSPNLRALVEALAGPGARLLVIEDSTVRVAHEALLRAWPRAQAVAHDEARFQDICRQLDEASRQQNFLTPGPLLSAAGGLLERLRAEPGMSDAVALLERSLGKEAQDLANERRRRRLFQMFSAALLALLTVAVVTGGFAIRQKRVAETNFHAADTVAGLMTGDVERALRERAGASVAIRTQLLETTALALQSLEVADGAERTIALLRGQLNAEEAETLRLSGRTLAARRAIESASDDLARGTPEGGGDTAWRAAQRDVLLIDGELALDIEDFDHARTAFTKATQLAEDVMKDRSGTDDAVRAYARALRGTGDVEWQGNEDAEGARSAYNRAVLALQPMADSPDANPELQTDLIQSRERIANLLLESDPTAALAIYRDNLAKAEGLARSPVSQPALQNSLSISREQLAQALIYTSPPDYDRARQLLTQERDTRITLHRQDPQNDKLSRNLAVIHNRLGFVLREMGADDQAAVETAAASDIFDDLAAHDRSNPRAAREAAWAHVDEGDLLLAVKACGKADVEYAKATEVLRSTARTDSDRFSDILTAIDGKRAALASLCAGAASSSLR